jgi:hypothetical protein
LAPPSASSTSGSSSSSSSSSSSLPLSISSMAARIRHHQLNAPPALIRLRSRPPQPTREAIILGTARRQYPQTQ